MRTTDLKGIFDRATTEDKLIEDRAKVHSIQLRRRRINSIPCKGIPNRMDVVFFPEGYACRHGEDLYWVKTPSAMADKIRIGLAREQARIDALPLDKELSPLEVEDDVRRRRMGEYGDGPNRYLLPGEKMAGKAYFKSRGIKLTPEMVAEIKSNHKKDPTRWTYSELAREFGVTSTTIRSVILGTSKRFGRPSTITSEQGSRWMREFDSGVSQLEIANRDGYFQQQVSKAIAEARARS